MAIRQRNGKWQIDVKVAGSRHREQFNGSEEDAQIREAVIRKALKEGDLIPEATVSGSVYQTSSSALLLENALETIWQRYWSEGGQARTVRSNMKTCFEFFGADRDIRTITTDDADAYIDWCRQQGWSPSTICKKCHPMTKMYTHYARRGNVKNPPFFDTPTIESNHRNRVITQAEFDQVIELLRGPYDQHHARGDSPCGDDWADFFQLLWDTGMRPKEAAHLLRINLRDDMLYIARTKTDNPRTLPLTAKTLDAFHRQAAARGDMPFAWAHSQYTKAWNWCRDQMGLAEDAGFIPYALRHTCATRLYAATRDLLVVQRWLGHKNIQMTVRYAKLQPHDLANARDLLQEAA